MEKIELIVFDIDGVITDGSMMVDSNGKELKRINLKDVDAIYELHNRGYKIAAITGEDTEIVKYFEKRFPWEYFMKGSKTKKDAMLQIEEKTGITREHICYVGDGKYDVEPLSYAGLGLCPANAIDKAKNAADMILQNNGGEGCIWELISILEEYNNYDSAQNYIYRRTAEHMSIFKAMSTDKDLMDAVMAVGNKIIDIFKDNKRLFLCGNGGSAADAQHIATEFVSKFYTERKGLNAEALTTNTSTITAIGNDYSFEHIFERQLEAKASSGDMVIGISTSGRSKDVLQALEYASKNGIITVLLAGGYDVPKTGFNIDYSIRVPAKITPRIQETHIFLGHVIAEYVEWRMFGQNDD
ncbi:SIS domain-containing protein [Butyrivibrio sp. JL13D10]|uniref:SIS domain-containing protein n=1 Tax=Butyrivibrio sp. JL13D10 TaxID=3236815 RepID=UPI0038B6AB61